MKRFILGCVLAASCAAFADEITFPTGGGDLATGWGSGKPSATDTAVVSQGGTYTLSDDATFGSVKVTTDKAVTFDFRSTPTRTLTLKNSKRSDGLGYPADAGYGFAPLVNAAENVTFRGGIWDFAGTNHFYGVSSGTANTGGSLTIADGAVLTNVATFYFGEHSVGHTVKVAGARVHAVKLTNWATGRDNSFVVTNGGAVYLSSVFQTDMVGNPGSGTGRNEIRVSGPGSLLVAKGTGDNHYVGSNHQRGGLVAADAARLEVSGTVLVGNTGTADDSYIRVTGCATAIVETVKLGSFAGAERSRFDVLDGAYAEVGNLSVGLGGETSWNRVTVSNAAMKITSALAFPSAWSSRSNEFWIVDGGKLEGVTESKTVEISASPFNTFGVRNASVSFNAFLLGTSGDDHYGNNTLMIADGAEVAMSAVSNIGQGQTNNAIVVSNATLTCPGAYVGSGGTQNRLRIDGGTVHVTGSTSFIAGNSETAYSNRVEIVNGSLVDAQNVYAKLVIGKAGSFNEMLVADSCLTTGTFKVCDEASAAYNRATFRNVTFATVDPTSGLVIDPFGYGHDGEVTFDGTDWDARATYLRIAREGSNDVLRVIGGSTVCATSNTVSVGYSSPNSFNNTIYVGAGSKLEVVRFRFMCRDSRLVVSNGTIKVTSGDNIDLAYRENGVNSFSSNNVLRLEGATPCATAGREVLFRNSARLEVAMPPTGYEPGYVPIKGKKVTFDATATIVVEGDEFFAHTGGTHTLAEATNSISLPQSVIDASLAKMPAGCRIWVQGKRLRFHAPSRKGTVLLIR